MTTDGIEDVFPETHHWGRAAKFFQAGGFDGEPGMQVVLKAPDAPEKG